MSDAILHLPTSVDEALLDATRISMLAEQTGLPLLPWQQRVIDLACIVCSAMEPPMGDSTMPEEARASFEITASEGRC